MKYISTILLILLFSTTLAGCTSSEDITEETPNDSEDVLNSNTPQTGDTDIMIDQIIYPHDEVVEVNIAIDENEYSDLIANAMDEEYHTADITYNGYTIYNVGIRTKGNSSLKDVVQSGGDRFSYNIDLNLYEDQDLFGIDKIILNNIFKDPTYMAEFVTYEALESLGLPTPRTTYVKVSINDEYYGLYLSVEQIGNEFVEDQFGNDEGELYKPEMGIGADLNYISDTTLYTALYDKINDSTDNTTVIEFMKRLETGESIEEIFDVDNYLKYLAVSTYTVNLDSYQSGAWHNYYLYNNKGVIEWIGWDYNMAFNGFPMVTLTDEQATEYLIDEPTIGALEDYPLIDAILSNETYLETYHTYLQELVDGYFNTDTFTSRVEEITAMIDSYVETDPSAFFTYSEYQKAIYTSSSTTYSLLQFVEERNSNVQGQLDGAIESTNDGNGNSGGIPIGGGGLPPRR